MIPPHDFDSPPHLTSYGKVRRAGTYREPLDKERTSNFQSFGYHNVAHNITGNAWKVRGIVFFFFGWIERGKSMLHLAKSMEKKGTQEQIFFWIFCSWKAV